MHLSNLKSNRLATTVPVFTDQARPYKFPSVADAALKRYKPLVCNARGCRKKESARTIGRDYVNSTVNKKTGARILAPVWFFSLTHPDR